MEVLKNFGFDPVLLFAQIINFLIILYLLKKFLYKPILDILKLRQVTIEKGLKQAEDAKITLEKALEEERKILAKAKISAQQVIDDAKESSIELSQTIEANAKKETERLINDALSRIFQESKLAEERLSEKTVVMATDIAEKALTNLIGKKEQKTITASMLKKLKK